MTTTDELPEPPVVTETQELAQKVVTGIVDYLARLGWDYAVLSVARRIDLGVGHSMAPGATGMHVDMHRMAPALANEASALRIIAQQLEDMHQGAGVTLSSYVQDKSDYASGRREWPR
jgi:hypothetical protein